MGKLTEMQNVDGNNVVLHNHLRGEEGEIDDYSLFNLINHYTKNHV